MEKVMEILQPVLREISIWTIPLIFIAIIVMGLTKGVKVYESFIEGGKEGFTTFIRILPYLIAIFIAIGMMRECGIMDIIAGSLGKYLRVIRMPSEVFPVALMRPLSGTERVSRICGCCRLRRH
ncbi:MAG: hypothetical protein ABI579_07925 [Candidatus Sumerlaeota bacterium]